MTPFSCGVSCSAQRPCAYPPGFDHKRPKSNDIQASARETSGPDPSYRWHFGRLQSQAKQKVPSSRLRRVGNQLSSLLVLRSDKHASEVRVGVAPLENLSRLPQVLTSTAGKRTAALTGFRGGAVTALETMRLALDALRAHKLRSFLTLLGVILAVTTLVAVMSVVSGMNFYV